MRKSLVILAVVFVSLACTLWQFSPDSGMDLPTPVSVLSTNTPRSLPTSTPTEGISIPTPSDTPTITPTSLPPTLTFTPTRVNAVYLPFEHGFMAYVEGADCLYAYAETGDWSGVLIPEEIRTQEMGHYRYCTVFAGLPDAPSDAPEGDFGRVWARYPELQPFLGMVVGEAEHYATIIPPSEPVVMGGVFYSGTIMLPDGRALYCGTRGATAGDCELRSGRLPY